MAAGSVCDNLPCPEFFGIEGKQTWYYEDTNEPFDYYTVITDDITIYAKNNETQNNNVIREDAAIYIMTKKQVLIILFSVVAMAGFGLMAVITEFYRKRKIKNELFCGRIPGQW